MVAVLERRIQDGPAVRAPCWREVDRVIVGHLKFFAAVQMGNINFFEPAAAVGNVSDTCVENTRDPGELVDDFVDKFVRDPAKVSHATGVTFADPLLVLVDVKKPQLNRDLITLNRKAALHQPLGADGRPILQIESAERNTARLSVLEVSRPI